MKTLKILMLEDNQLDADLIREELTENKFDFTSELVETEKDFIKAIHDFKPDIILSDYTLPQFNGMEAIILTKEISPLVPVIIVTGLINEEIAVECIKAGAMDYVLKENLIRLGPAITQVLEKKALIKARIKTEEALRESEKRLRSFFENSIMGIYRTTAQGDILSANPALLRMLGYSCFEELKTRNLEKEGYETGYERSIFKKNLEKNGKVVGLESAWTRKDGSTIFIRESSIAVKDDENNVLHYEGTVEDITEHKKAEKVQLVLYNIAKAVNTTKNLDQLYHTIHHLLGNIIYNSNFYIALYDEDKNIISFPYYIDEKDAKPEPVPQKLSKGLTNYVLQTGKSLLATKEDYKRLAKEGKIEISGSISEIWVGIPLRVEEMLIGVMVLQSYKDTSAFNEKDLEILEHISYQIAIAIENKRTEQINLRLSETIRNANDGIILTTLKGRITYINPAFEKMSGYKLSELLDTDPVNLIINEDTTAIGNKIRHAVKKTGEWKRELYCKRKNEEIYPIETRVFAIKNEKGEIVEIAAIQQDITERKQAEEDLRESEKRFKHLVKNSNDIIVIIDEKANETYVNDSVEHITGFSPAELLGHSGFEFLHPDDVDNMSKTLSKLSKTPGGTIRSEYRHKRKDGGWVYLEAMGTNYLHDPSIKGIVLNIHDITERKKAQAKLIASEKEIRELATRWQTTFDAMSDSVSIIDLEGHILQYNSTTLTILKTTAKQIKLKKCWEIVHALSEPIDNCPTVRVKKSQHKESMEFQTDERWLNVAVDPIFDDTGKLKGAVHVVSNITEQKLAEVKLRESEAHYRQLFNMLPYGCEILDLKGNIIDCNLSTTKMLGYKRVDLIGKHIGNFIDAKTIKSFPQVFSRILKGETFSGEACQIHKNGSKINILRSGAQIVNSKGEIESVITLSVDITERKKAEVKLRESEERYRTIFEATGTAILIVDEETTVIQANRECERVTGYLASELVGKSWTKFVYEEDLLTMLKNAKARIKDPKSVSNKYEVRLINAKGEIRNTIISIGMISGSKRSIVSMIDMTERKQVEIALKKSENKLLATFGAMMDIIIVYDSDGYYLEIAPTNPANLSHSMQNLLGKSVTEVFPPEQADFFLQNIRLTLKTKQLTSVEYSLRIGDKDIWFSTLISPLSDNSVVWVARDITEKKQAEKNLKQRMQDLEIFNDVAVDREIMINDHRKEINELLEKLGEKTKYEIVE